MESPPTDRIRDDGKATHTDERLDLVERMRTKRLSSPIKLLYRKKNDNGALYFYVILISLYCTNQENTLVQMGGM